MSRLLDKVLDAHGGLQRWRSSSMLEATIISGGKLWQIKGQPQDPAPRRMTVALQREWASVQPFGAPDQRTDFTPERIAIEKLDGRVVAQRADPRASFTGHVLETPWDPLQRAYFNGYAHLLCRHDYRVDVAGGFAAIQYVYDIVQADGIKLPSKRRAYRCDADGRPIADDLMVSIDVSDVHLS
jgi:hypothetical protein